MSIIDRPGRRIDLTGQRFGRLVAKCYSGNRHHGKLLWLCQCDCGNTCEVNANHLAGRGAKSCGCLNRESSAKTGKNNATHGMKRTPEYRSWIAMKTRCLNKHAGNYQDYGGRGISIFPEWIVSFEAFFAHMGPKPSQDMSIERIDVNGNYEPGNVKWGTLEEQNNNRRDNRRMTAFGETMTISQWARRFGLKSHIIYQRLNRGWSIEQTLKTPVKAYKAII